LVERGYVQSAVAPCIFTKDTPCGGYQAVRVFEDDLIALNASAVPDAFTELAESLKECFEVTVMVLDKFLGAQFDIESAGVRMHLTQYITGLLTRFDMESCKTARNPELTRDDAESPPDETLLDRAANQRFQEMVDALMFASTTCVASTSRTRSACSRAG
jgi:hypothetical protein